MSVSLPTGSGRLAYLQRQVPCRHATSKRMKMGYTGPSKERIEVDLSTSTLSPQQEVTKVRPEPMIVTTCASRNHVKGTFHIDQAIHVFRV